MTSVGSLAYLETFYTQKLTAKVVSIPWLWNRTLKTKSHKSQNITETARLLYPAEPSQLKVPSLQD